MPLGNLTKMTAEERQKVIQWIAQGAQFPHKKTPDQVERLLASKRVNSKLFSTRIHFRAGFVIGLTSFWVCT